MISSSSRRGTSLIRKLNLNLNPNKNVANLCSEIARTRGGGVVCQQRSLSCWRRMNTTTTRADSVSMRMYHQHQQRHQQIVSFSTKRSGGSNRRRPPVGGGAAGKRRRQLPKIQQQKDSNSLQQKDFPYGMKRIDYSSSKPPKWPLPPHPPPKQNPVKRYFPITVFAIAVGFFGYIYFNQDEEVFEYWKQVEQGNVPLPDDDDGEFDDDDDDDDDDGWEEDSSEGKQKKQQ